MFVTLFGLAFYDIINYSFVVLFCLDINIKKRCRNYTRISRKQTVTLEIDFKIPYFFNKHCH